MSNDHVNKKDWEEVLTVLARLRNPAEIQAWATALLTPTERQRLTLRWKLVRMLAEGMPQREISKQLGVSLCKITRGSRELKKGPAIFRKIVAESVQASQPKLKKGNENE